MTVSSPPSRPEPDGGETGSGSVRSPPSPSNNEGMSTSATSSGQTQSTVEGTGIQKSTIKQVSPSITTQIDIEQERIENKVQNNTETIPMSNNEITDNGQQSPSLGSSDALIRSFPIAKLQKLDELISNPRWVIPVLPKGELEVLLEASIRLSKAEADKNCEPCQRFYREGLLTSFTKIMTDEAVSSWRFDIHKCILRNCERLVELCVVKLHDDWFPLLDLLAMVLNPANKFHLYNGSRPSEFNLKQYIQQQSEQKAQSDNPEAGDGSVENTGPNTEPYARSIDARSPKGWIVDLINRFGYHGGFQKLLDRFQLPNNAQTLTVALVYSLVRPFGQCYELLTQKTVTQYLLPIIEAVPKFLDSLNDEDLKKEAKNESKNDAVSAIIKSLKSLASCVPSQEENIRQLEMFRLKMILRQLQISSFGGKMNALNEVNRVITSVSYYPQQSGPNTQGQIIGGNNQGNRQTSGGNANLNHEEEDFLTADRMAVWLKENRVLQIVLQDSLHQPQYVEKLEKVIRFIIKEKSLTLEDLHDIWNAQVGQHEAIVKNIHDLLAKLAWDFSPEQLDQLFECFQRSWSTANAKQREKLLELIRRLAEDDKDGVMADKVLTLFWNLAHSSDVSIDIMDQALSAHVKILDYSCTQYRETQKTRWLHKCIEELKISSTWVLPALKQIREICCLYQEAPTNAAAIQNGGQKQVTAYRHDIINKLQTDHALVILVADNLTDYVEQVRRNPKKVLEGDPSDLYPDGRYNHLTQIQERLNFLRFLLKDGQLWLCAPQAKQIWNCLAENAVFAEDREACAKWFSKLMGEEPDLDPEINKDFFENNILQLDPSLMTENGIKCFDRFFKAVNVKENKLVAKRRAYLMNDTELIGLDYIWRLVLCSDEEIANRAIELLKETFTNLGPHLQNNQVEIHEDFISSCIDRLKASYDTITMLERGKDSIAKFQQETTRLCRVLKVLHEYVMECDADFCEERTFVPLYRASRGKQLMLLFRFPNQGRQVEDVEIWTHTNDTLGAVRRQILQRLKGNPSNVKLELFLNGDLIDTIDDRKILLHLPLRDKTLLTGKLTPTTTGSGGGIPASSPDSSSDSSTSSPQHPQYDGGPNIELEQCLPGVILSQQKPVLLEMSYCQFFLKLADVGCSMGCAQLRDGARALLKLMPADSQTVQDMKAECQRLARLGSSTSTTQPQNSFDSLFFLPSSSLVLYNLEVCHSLLLPGNGPVLDKAFDFQLAVCKAKGIPAFIGMLTRNNFLSTADLPTKRLAYFATLKICKLLFAVAGHSLVHMVADACNPESDKQVSSVVHNQAVILQQALHQIPSPTQEMIIRSISQRLATQLLELGASHMPDRETVAAIIRLAWASSSGNLDLLNVSTDELHEPFKNIAIGKNPDSDDIALCREALDVLTLAIALYPQCLDVLSKDKSWHQFIIDIVLLNKVRSIRLTGADQFLLMATRCSGEPQQPIRFFITLLFTVLGSTATEHSKQSAEYFILLSRLLSFASGANIPINTAESLLNSEIAWLKKMRETVRRNPSTGNSSSSNDKSSHLQYDDNLLEGHLCLCRDLLAFMPPEKKYDIGSNNKTGVNLVKELIEDFVFPASKMITVFKQTNVMPMGQVTPVCNTAPTLIAAFDLLVGLCTDCIQNLNVVAQMLIEMFYSDKDDVLTEWEYLPPIGPRPQNGFVGLKNAGATCYMNSVLQQLFMIEPIKYGVLSAEGACNDQDEDFSGEDREGTENVTDFNNEIAGSSDADNYDSSRKDYNVTILKQVQAIFGHLSKTKLQFYVPKGLWKHFRMQGEPVNLREQQDAVEFYIFLIDFVDEALKGLGYEKRMTKILGGVYSDQKICKTCPCRYSREEPFSVISVDIKNHSNLTDSLHEYVKGELLDGSNAYYCERCDKKVDTTKRLCVKKLPPILVIQLKRFDYDYERECAIKFNDYFEFPRNLDMEPYTVGGLAKIEGEAIDCDPSDLTGKAVRKYSLRGMVVHSGQASGGHYYSYIRSQQVPGGGENTNSKEHHWYKFDDGDVTEVKMDDDEELKAQCYGGEYMSEVFDHLLKRMSYRKQKRWWNAYMLFYTRNDYENMDLVSQMEALSLKTPQKTSIGIQDTLKCPGPIEKSIQKQNVRYLHHRNQFSLEFFQFMRKIINCNAPYIQPNQPNDKLSSEAEDIALITIQLAAKFLFTSGFHTKKQLRGPAQEWYETLTHYLRYSRQVRQWFCQKVLFDHPSRFCEYILECPTAEVRTAFVRIIVFIAHFSLNDGPSPAPQFLVQHHQQQMQQNPAFNSAMLSLSPPSNNGSLSDHLLQTILALLWVEVSEHGRHLSQYFTLFVMYASLGIAEKTQLLKLNVPAKFIQVALDEGPGPPIKYQYAELGKLYQVVSQLVRCCDISAKCQSAMEGKMPLPNPHVESSCPNQHPIMPMQPHVVDMLFSRSTYLKKLIEEANSQEDTKKLLQFCCWENPTFSHAVLYELLWQIAIAYTYELRPYLDLLLAVLLMEDSWQTLRIQKSLKGIPDEHSSREGLFDTITRSKSHYQKRAYQCIKLLVALFSQCAVAKQLLDSSTDIKRKWSWAVEWLNDELERGRGPYPGSGPYPSYNNWSPPAQSNETANGYFLERSHSARQTLERACELLPDEDLDAVEVEEHHVPINSGDSFQNASDNSIQQAASGTSTSDTSTIQSPSREIQEMKNTELRVSTTGHTPSHNSTQSTSNSFVVQPTTTSSNSNNLNQKSIPGSSTSVSTDITDFGSTKSDDKSENSDRR